MRTLPKSIEFSRPITGCASNSSTDQAHDEIVWFARRSMNVSLPAAKYPTPLDSSKNRYEYFDYEAQKMSQQAAHYENLSASATE